MNNRILLVDDDPNVLDSFKRQLRKRFTMDFACGGTAAIEQMANNDPYAIVVSDMQMPGIDGLQLLCHVKEHSPDTIRIMLTGNADQKTASDAVNKGRIFRFINKPCSSDALAEILTAGLEQYRLVTAEKELLSQTLNGSIDLMTDVLSMVNPVAFGRANRVRDIVKRLCPLLGLTDSWQIEVAAALSQIGSVMTPSNILEKFYGGEALPVEDQKLVDQQPYVASKLVGRIPRLQTVGQIIELATSKGTCKEEPLDGSVLEAAQLLDMVLTYDSLACNASPTEALRNADLTERFASQPDWLKALSQVVAENFVVSTVPVSQLTTAMILEEDLRTMAGLLLVTKGQQLSESLLARLANYLERDDICEMVKVRNPS